MMHPLIPRPPPQSTASGYQPLQTHAAQPRPPGSGTHFRSQFTIIRKPLSWLNREAAAGLPRRVALQAAVPSPHACGGFTASVTAAAQKPGNTHPRSVTATYACMHYRIMMYCKRVRLANPRVWQCQSGPAGRLRARVSSLQHERGLHRHICMYRDIPNAQRPALCSTGPTLNPRQGSQFLFSQKWEPLADCLEVGKGGGGGECWAALWDSGACVEDRHHTISRGAWPS